MLSSQSQELGLDDIPVNNDNNTQQNIQSPSIIDSIANFCNKMHRTVENETKRYFIEMKRYNYTTPTSYLELIKLYMDILMKQKQLITLKEERYRKGLDKLLDTEKVVSNLEIKLTEMQPVLVSASRDTERLLIQVTEDQTKADKQAAVVEVDVNEANIVAANVQQMKDECQVDLDEAMPAYEAAVKALNLLDRKSIQELKAFNNPPDLVKTTMEAVCILFEKTPDWGEAKKLLSQMDFMEKLISYNKDTISSRIIKKLEKYYNDPRFVPDEVKKQSQAAMCLCMWARAM